MEVNARGIRLWSLGLLTVALLVPTVASNAQQGGQNPTMTYRNLTLAHDSARAHTRKNGDAINNDTLRVEVVFKNPVAIALKSVVFDNPLPANLILIGGTATTSAPAKIEYSADGGKTFSTQPMIRANVNGQDVERPATPDQYTHIRWTVTGALAAGASVTARYDVRVGVRR
jgi:hypothetical protein